jgi:hypothetical protein
VQLRESTNEEGSAACADRAAHVGIDRDVAAGADRAAVRAGDDPAAISEVVFSDADTVREVTHNFNRDGFDALYPRYRGSSADVCPRPQRPRAGVHTDRELAGFVVVLGAASVPKDPGTSTTASPSKRP